MGKLKDNYCWVVCFAALIVLFLAIGMGTITFSIYHPFVIAQYGFSDGQASFLTTVRWLFSMLCLFVADRFYEKLNLRLGIALSLMCSVAGVFIFSFTRSYAGFCIASALTGIGHGMGGMMPVSLVVNRWFANRRAFVLGACVAGCNISDVISPPIITALLERYGVQQSFFIQAVFMLALSALAVLLLRNSPADIGAQPYFSAKAEKKRVKSLHIELRRVDWVLMFIVAIGLGALGGPAFSHIPVLLTSYGYDSMVIAQAVSVCGVAMFMGKFIYGAVTDRIGTIKSNGLFGSLAVASMALLCLAGNGSLAVVFAAVLCIGLGISLTTVGVSVWADDVATEQEYARALKRLRIGLSLGSLAFSPVPGMLADLTGSYLPSYILFTALMALSLVLVQYTYLAGKARLRKGQTRNAVPAAAEN